MEKHFFLLDTPGLLSLCGLWGRTKRSARSATIWVAGLEAHTLGYYGHHGVAYQVFASQAPSKSIVR